MVAAGGAPSQYHVHDLGAVRGGADRAVAARAAGVLRELLAAGRVIPLAPGAGDSPDTHTPLDLAPPPITRCGGVPRRDDRGVPRPAGGRAAGGRGLADRLAGAGAHGRVRVAGRPDAGRAGGAHRVRSPTEVNRTDRLYAIVEELRARFPWPVSRRWLAEHFEVSSRTIERDIAGLQQAAVPIWSQPGPEGGYGIDAGHTLPPLNLTALEATAVAVALAAAGDAPYAGHARTAAAKVAAVLTGTGGDPDTAARIRDTIAPTRSAIVAAVERAVAEGRVAELSYRDREGRTSRRQVECHGSPERARLVVGWCRLRDAGGCSGSTASTRSRSWPSIGRPGPGRGARLGPRPAGAPLAPPGVTGILESKRPGRAGRVVSPVHRVVAQLGRALRSGRRGREFKSPPPDQMQRAWSQALSPRLVAVLLAARSRFHRAHRAEAAPRDLAPIAAAAASLS